ncbi:uncharacterized protein [Nicotiana sylvestris]|uniref:uncharacterized protein n=1 Tax=Nicotiana sylvestris TaxID=4096 RepID=UPI00388CD211
MCETFKIKHRNSTAYKPQMNGAVETANKNIKKILKKMVDNCKKLHEKLQFALLGYRTTVYTSIGSTCRGVDSFPKNYIRGRAQRCGIDTETDEAKGKFSPNWKGPYMVQRVLTGGALILVEMDEEIWPKPFNLDAVKRYYI